MDSNKPSPLIHEVCNDQDIKSSNNIVNILANAINEIKSSGIGDRSITFRYFEVVIEEK